MIDLKFSSAGRPTNMQTEDAIREVRDYIHYFDENPFNSYLIQLVNNTLTDVQRIILIIYNYHGNNLSATAKHLHASTQYIKKLLQEIYSTIQANADPEYMEEERDLIKLI